MPFTPSMNTTATKSMCRSHGKIKIIKTKQLLAGQEAELNWAVIQNTVSNTTFRFMFKYVKQFTLSCR